VSLGVSWAQPGLYAGYHLADANDFSGNARNLSATGAPTYALQKFGNGVTFPASADLHKTSFGLGITSPCTQVAWINVGTQPGDGVTMVPVQVRLGTDPIKELYIGYRRDGANYYFDVGMHTIDSTTLFGYTWARQLDTGIWYCVGVAYSGSTNVLCALNGDVRSVTVTDGSLLSGAVNQLCIGDKHIGGGLTFLGSIDEVLVFNVQKSATWLRNWYAWSKGLLI